jgi:hypothetical protein
MLMQATDNREVERETTAQTKDPASSYPIETVEETHTQRNWPMLVALIIAALAFAILVVFAGRWVYHKVHHSTVLAPANTKELPKPPPSSVKPESGPSGSSNSNSESSSSNNLPTTGG